MTVFLTTAKDFSLLDLFISLLHKLAWKEFVSERLPRHCAIRQQVEALIHSAAKLQFLCAVFHEKIYSSIVATCTEWQTALVSGGIIALVPHVSHARGSAYMKEQQHTIRDVGLILLEKKAMV